MATKQMPRKFVKYRWYYEARYYIEDGMHMEGVNAQHDLAVQAVLPVGQALEVPWGVTVNVPQLDCNPAGMFFRFRVEPSKPYEMEFKEFTEAAEKAFSEAGFTRGKDC